MAQVLESPFDSLESAHNFVSLLSDAVADGKRDIDADIQRELNSNLPRRLDALRLAVYNLEKLEQYLNKSRRILNDLRSLRRLLFDERTAGKQATIKPRQEPEAASQVTGAPRPRVSPSPSRPVPPSNGGSVAAA